MSSDPDVPATREPIASVEVDSFSYARNLDESVLNDVRFTVDRGEVVGIFGPTGAGKTTLISCLNGLVPDIVPGRIEGEIRIDGADSVATSASELAGTVGTVMENPDTQILGLTVLEDIGLGPANLGKDAAAIRERTDELVAKFDLEGYENQNPNNLSGGEQQSLALASILSMDPDLLLLDEPVSMLDPKGTERTFEMLSRLLRDNPDRAVVITGSGPDIEESVPYFDRLLLLNDRGELVADGSPSDVVGSDQFDRLGLRRPDVSELFVGTHDPSTAVDRLPLTVEEAAEQLAEQIPPGAELTRPDSGAVRTTDCPAAVSVEGVTFAYETENVLKDVSIELYEGEVLGLVGQNGSGKTTLCKLVVGLLSAGEGRIRVNGTEVEDYSPDDLIRTVNYVYQNPDDQLVKDDIGGEVSMGLSQMGLADDEIRRRVTDVLERFGIADIRDAKISMLDMSEKSLVQIASLVVMDPDVLILDEPTRGLDHTEITTLFERLNDVRREQGMSLVVVSHHMRYVADWCDRLAVLSDGRVHMSGGVREVFSQPDRLSETDITPPGITQLGQRLSNPGVPDDVMDVDEMRALLGREVTS
jgi:energy-coupling factor transport system ATP-binding protein